MLSLSLKKKRARYAFNISKKERVLKILVFQFLGRQLMTLCTKQNCSASRNIQCTCACVCVCVCVCVHAHACVHACVRVCILKFPKHFSRCIALAMCDLLRHACCLVLLALYGSSNSTTISTNYYNAVVMRMNLYSWANEIHKITSIHYTVPYLIFCMHPT